MGNLHIAFAMIGADTILFSLFFYKFICLLNADENGHKIPANEWNGFMIQFLCVLIAMLTCVADGVIHLFYIQHDMKLVFVLDAIIVSMCNMAMLKETQQAILEAVKSIKVICCNCSMKIHQEPNEKQIAKMVHVAKMKETKVDEEIGRTQPKQTQSDDAKIES